MGVIHLATGMIYKSLRQCVVDLERYGHLVRVKEEVDPELEMAAIHLRVHEAGGPALLYENIRGCKYPAVSNLFGTIERTRFIFRDTLSHVKKLVSLRNNPLALLKSPIKSAGLVKSAFNSIPQKSFSQPEFERISIDQLPQIKCWKKDGGAFITLPQVYSEDLDKPGILNSNLGMYRIQLNGNDYSINKEVGLHYQLHRGIGVHQAKANTSGQPLKVSIFIGGPPAHSVAAVMPLPEGMSELTFAGILAGRRFRYRYHDGFLISTDADFIITGEVHPGEVKPEGPFGDHLGYYSLVHDFPLMRVKNVYAKKDAIYPFTVVGRPPQEDTQFGAMIHEITGDIIPKEIPGLHQVNAVDAAGVHPLLLAIGSERYTPFVKERKPQEILTIANHILGTGQMSLAKYLIIAAKEDQPDLDANDISGFFKHILERVDFTRDLHFHTNVTIDTLDYSGPGLNSGSKLVVAVAGNKRRELGERIDIREEITGVFSKPMVAMKGVLMVQGKKYIDKQTTGMEIKNFENHFLKFSAQFYHQFPLIIVCDDTHFSAKSLNNFLWVTFTRSNPAADIYGINSFFENKHWGCRGPLIIDARIKPHHAPALQSDPEIEKRVDALGQKGKSLHGII